ncbi:PAS domain-containing protein [Salinibaculum salinum]|uniref:hybrid sensor histidine kinase/response regulator n=1 Tax=Salinibaculum salinum TaxID=3131996 RepID=UPI0030EC5FA9
MNQDDGTIRVLHIEDEPAFAELTTEMLERENERLVVETARHASDGLDRLTETEVDCIVSDYQMPGKDGIEFLETVREQDEELPFILFTGEGSERVASEAISAGATDYLQKGGGTEKFELLAHRIQHAVTRTRAEREQQRRLDAIETAQEGISILDSEGRYTYVNEAYADIFGYEPEEMLGESKAITYRDETTFTADVLPVLRDQGNVQREATGERGDGSPVPIRYSLATTGTDGFVCTVQDLSERRANERAQDAIATVLRTVVENLPLGVLVEDADRNIRLANDRLGEILNLSAAGDDLTGRNCDAAVEEVKELFDDPDGFVADIEERIDNREPVYEEKIEVADGRTLERDYIPYTLPDGPANLWLYRDITERTVRKRELQRNDRRFEAVFESPDSFLAVLDPDGRVRRVNETALEFVETDLETVAGKPFWRTPWWNHSESLQQDLQNWIGQAASGDHVRFEAFHYAPDGEKVTADGVIRPVTDDNGEVVSLVAEARDITERKQRKQALERQNERLDKFTSVVSHDLRNPMNVAKSRLELASEEYESAHLEHVSDALDRMETLIDDLLTFAREGKEVQNTEPVSLAQTVTDCWQNVETRDVVLTVETEQTIRANQGRLRQLLANLLRNAVDHGGDDVTVRVDEVEDGFYVADDGQGIPEAERENVFEAGYSTADDGTGFGLNIVQEIATAHGWNSRITESADGGARFEFTGVEFVEEN